MEKGAKGAVEHLPGTAASRALAPARLNLAFSLTTPIVLATTSENIFGLQVGLGVLTETPLMSASFDIVGEELGGMGSAERQSEGLRTK
ncbi:hypothetical protein SUGI_1053240 [Cryptomeria japonica]|nr:hypothetical protein SUGI_1053240 [Cryptomeria japonica]